MELLCLLVCMLIAYLIGSISFALIIGKVFYKVDVRLYGSKNAGGSNAGRVLGKKACVIIILLDALKVVGVLALNALIITKLFNIQIDDMTYTYCQELALFTSVLGHCFPVYSKFSGGKAVASTAGAIAGSNYVITPISAVIFFATLFISKMVSLSSLIGGFSIVVLSFIKPLVENFMLFNLQYDIVFPLTMLMIYILLLYRHKENIIRIKNKEERKITWLGKKK